MIVQEPVQVSWSSFLDSGICWMDHRHVLKFDKRIVLGSILFMSKSHMHELVLPAGICITFNRM